jgi:hypothetical protein
MRVFIVWDQSRKEHGEPAELLDVFLSVADAESYRTEDPECWVAEEDTTIEEREVKGFLDEESVKNLIAGVLNAVRPGMRVVIGDRTTAQYDKADKMAEYITSAVRYALTQQRYLRDEDGEPEAA